MLDSRDAGAGGVADRGAKRGLRHIGALGLEQTLASAGQSGAEESDPGVDVGRMKDKLSGRRGVYADALDDYPIAQRCLRPKPHQLHPDFRPALIRAVGCDVKRPGFPPRCY